jgi:DNA polymerase-3 subunit epsilon
VNANGFCVIDTETNGLPDNTKPADAEGQPRVASAALIFTDRDLNPQHTWHGLVKPDGWTMPPEVQAINGLSMERLTAEGLPILLPLSLYALALDEGRTIVAHNFYFDAKLMRGELRRAKMDDRYAKTGSLCTMIMARRLCSRAKLTVVYQELIGQPYEGAHGALADAQACLAVLRAIRDRGVRLEPSFPRNVTPQPQT